MTLPRLHPSVMLGIKAIVSLLALWLVMSFIDLSAVLTSLKNADAALLGIGILLSAIQLVMHLYRWKYLVNIADPSIGMNDANVSFFVGNAAGFITPAQLGEFIGRIASHPTSDKAKILGISVIDKAYIASMTFIIGGIGLTAFGAELYPEHWHWAYRYIATFIFGIAIALMIYPSMVIKTMLLLPASVRTHRFYKVAGVLENDFTDRNGRRTAVWTFIIYLVILAENYILLNAFADVPYETALIGTGAVLFFKAFIFPFSFSDIGVREGAAVFFFGAMGIGSEAAFNTSVLITFFNVLLPTAYGAFISSRLIRRQTQ